MEEKFPKLLFRPYGMGGAFKGFTVFETDDPDKLMNHQLVLMPEVKVEYAPIFEFSKLFKLYQEMKK